MRLQGAVFQDFLSSEYRLTYIDTRPPPVCTKKRGTYLEKTSNLISHLINRSRWRGERFWPATRRDAGRPQFSKRNSLTGQLTRGGLGKSILAAALTEEQRRGRPKDPPFLLRLRCTDFLIPIEIPVQNAAAGIYEMASKVNGWLTELTDSLTDRTSKITRFYRGPNGLTARNKYIPPLAAPKPPAKAGRRAVTQ